MTGHYWKPEGTHGIAEMTGSRLHNDKDADRLWRRCGSDANLRWLLEGVLTPRQPDLGRTLLLSPVEIFGEVKTPVGRKLSLLFRLTGLPYLSGEIKDLSKSLHRMMLERSTEAQQARNAKKAIAEWAEANGQQAQNLVVAAVLETVRRNDALRALATSHQPVTSVEVAQQISDYKGLDWKAINDLVLIFEQFLARSRSKKPINRFTLNFTALLRLVQPEISQIDLIFRSAEHFVSLLKRRGVKEGAWRHLLLRLIDRGLVTPNMSMFLWCRKFPEDGFIASLSLALGTLPPFCPSCRSEAHAMASFVPAGGFLDAMRLKDGLLGAAIGWHLKKLGIEFLHGHCEEGTEIDFIPKMPGGQLLVECKTISVLVSAKQMLRNLREAVTQVHEHRALLERRGWKLRNSVCVVNLTQQDLTVLQRDRSSPRIPQSSLVSYERFPAWLRAQVTAR